MLKPFFAFVLSLLLCSNLLAQSPSGSSYKITQPNASSMVEGGGDFTNFSPLGITVSGDPTDTISIEYTTDGGVTWYLIYRIHPGLITFMMRWYNIPDVNATAQIRIRDTTGVRATSESFKIVERRKILTAFINENNWPVPQDADVVIDWEMNADSGPIRISWSQEPSSGWVDIETSLPGSARSYVWHTPPFELSQVWITIRIGNGESRTIGPFSISGHADVNAEEEMYADVYPNPASDHITIARATSVEIIDLLGAAVLRQDVPDTNSDLDVTALPVGDYIVRLLSGRHQKLRTLRILR